MLKKTFFLTIILGSNLAYGMYHFETIDVEKIRSLHVVITTDDGTQIEGTINNLNRKGKMALRSMLEKDSINEDQPPQNEIEKVVSEEQPPQTEIEKAVDEIPYCSTKTPDELIVVIKKYVGCFLGNNNSLNDSYVQMIDSLSSSKSFEDFQEQLNSKVGALLECRKKLVSYAPDDIALQIFLWNEKIQNLCGDNRMIERAIWAKICDEVDMPIPRSKESLKKCLLLIQESKDKVE